MIGRQSQSGRFREDKNFVLAGIGIPDRPARCLVAILTATFGSLSPFNRGSSQTTRTERTYVLKVYQSGNQTARSQNLTTSSKLSAQG